MCRRRFRNAGFWGSLLTFYPSSQRSGSSLRLSRLASRSSMTHRARWWVPKTLRFATDWSIWFAVTSLQMSSCRRGEPDSPPKSSSTQPACAEKTEKILVVSGQVVESAVSSPVEHLFSCIECLDRFLTRSLINQNVVVNGINYFDVRKHCLGLFYSSRTRLALFARHLFFVALLFFCHCSLVQLHLLIAA